MLRLIPDWLLYIVVIAVMVFILFKVDQRSNAPEALPDATQNSAFLPPPSVYDPEILVEVGPQSSGLGTAFAVTPDGWWVTARHVVDACARVGIIVSRGAAAPVRQVRVAQFADLALLKTDRAPSPLAIETVERNLQVGQRAFHVGFPQGHPGEAYSRLIGRENLIARGRYDVDEPVLTWAELGRTSGMSGSLAGMSGGPAFDANGEVIGVTIAESARRGRLYTASPATILRMLRVEQIHAQGSPAPRFTTDNYGQESDALRRSLAVAQVVCVTDDTPS